MRTVGVLAAKNELPSLLREVERGGEVVITRRGRPVARLGPIERAFDRAGSRAAAEGLRRASKGLSLGGLSIKELIEEGRD
ncbi:MAG TPA: type II toxin-antitoxin system prevent-host-death family antitoxin [Caulobacteraceae bacterium]|nr:type II toxin-antitoxin system prevent-host-death family antitoxin [Caulobacteraceae bacterium]